MRRVLILAVLVVCYSAAGVRACGPQVVSLDPVVLLDYLHRVHVEYEYWFMAGYVAGTDGTAQADASGRVLACLQDNRHACYGIGSARCGSEAGWRGVCLGYAVGRIAAAAILAAMP